MEAVIGGGDGRVTARGRAALRRIERRERVRALVLILPLVVFLLVGFVLPVGMMLMRSVTDSEIPTIMPRTSALMRQWHGRGMPPAAAVAIFARELAAARVSGKLGLVANRLNYDIDGFRGLIFKTALNSQAARADVASLAAIDRRWSDPAYWVAIRRASHPFTTFYLLAALDRHTDASGRVVLVSANQRVFVRVFLRTFRIGILVTATTLLLGYPLAYMLANISTRISNLLMIVVLLPFWTSVLVRTTAWVVLLQREGVINDALHWLGLISQPLALIYNRTGVYIAMTYVLLPFMVLPLYGVMRTVSPTGMRAALSLGAPPLTAFKRVYLPQTLPGVSAGSLLVFILAIGFYTTPALVGGAADQLISYFILFYTNQTLNWGMAAALSVVLLATTLGLCWLYYLLTRHRGSRLGTE